MNVSRIAARDRAAVRKLNRRLHDAVLERLPSFLAPALEGSRGLYWLTYSPLQ